LAPFARDDVACVDRTVKTGYGEAILSIGTRDTSADIAASDSPGDRIMLAKGP
jgi:hypothetical protein